MARIQVSHTSYRLYTKDELNATRLTLSLYFLCSEGGTFILKLDFPTQYPFKPPKLKFLTKVYHPSVQLESGDVCQDVVGQWGPTLNAKHCLSVIYSMLQSPESDHPLEEDIAQQLREKPKEFDKTAKKYTKDYAK
jgi:ubiquitin-protein ligase